MMPEVESRRSFSLLDEAWVPCLGLDGETRALSLRDVFAQAGSVRDIVGELPTQTFAIIRLMLAVMHRALGESVRDEADWGEIWSDGLPVDAIQQYLERYRDRFDLLHPETPFFQVAGLHTAKHEVKDITPLLFDVPSNNRLFTGRAGRALGALDYDEAARWLVHLQCFDVSGIKSGAVGDERVRGGKGFPIGTGWGGMIGGLLVEGRTLAQTLVLNFVPASTREAAGDLPPWERAPDTAAARADETPRGPVDLMTWQSRRVRLVHDGAAVTGCVVANGDRITPQNRFGLEQHSAWRYSRAQTKGAGGPVYMPREHQPAQAYWRGIAGLLVRREASAGAGAPARLMPPGVLQWLARMQRNGELPRSQPIAPHAYGVVYGSQQSVVSDVINDRYLVPLAALDEQRQPRLAGAARSGVEAAAQAVRELGNLAGNLALAAGQRDSGQRDRALETGYHALDRPFRAWLAALDVERDAEQQLDAWKREVKRMILRFGEALVARAGDAAWRGRAPDPINATQLMNSAIAEERFERALRKNLAMLSTDAASTHPNTEDTDG
ncbi:type I-E CRISPR-associated protein Cse1/CasA [Leucobacter allii]|uniref:type I-E CRISPR-associated protein Cse1/CasA n=1 Tax=Leucobacter allii TaxID=2932247 RepID=UPI001FD2ECAB|nr:type I-E CRISPR-associated protein Cse1/CasA [Leucobacter allii]UOR01725.1 type I-E CRISPR-associated protein Cse1/CasA [Leucobacter allii]